MGVMGWEWPRKRSGNWGLMGILLGHVPPFSSLNSVPFLLRTSCVETVVAWQRVVAGSVLIRGTPTWEVPAGSVAVLGKC